MTTTTALNKVSFYVSRVFPGYEAVCDSPLLPAFFSRSNESAGPDTSKRTIKSGSYLLSKPAAAGRPSKRGVNKR